MHEPFDEYLRGCLKVELLKLTSLRAIAVLPPELQGPPNAGHGGGGTALLLEMIRMVVGERGGEALLPRPLRMEVTFHRSLPLDTPLRAEVDEQAGVWHARIVQDATPVIEGRLSSAAAMDAVPAELGRLSRGSPAEWSVPRYEWCLACGRSNARGAQLRFAYSDHAVWHHLSPPAGFRTRDGSVALAYFCIVADELGWWLGALRQGECGLTSRLIVALGAPVRFGTSLLAIGARSEVRSQDPKGRFWDTKCVVLTKQGQPVAQAEVQFAASRAFTKTMLPGFIAEDAAAVGQAFPRYAERTE